jgi:hypothetical protein
MLDDNIFPADRGSNEFVFLLIWFARRQTNGNNFPLFKEQFSDGCASADQFRDPQRQLRHADIHDPRTPDSVSIDFSLGNLFENFGPIHVERKYKSDQESGRSVFQKSYFLPYMCLLLLLDRS